MQPSQQVERLKKRDDDLLDVQSKCHNRRLETGARSLMKLLNEGGRPSACTEG